MVDPNPLWPPRWVGRRTTYHPSPSALPTYHPPWYTAPDRGALLEIRRGPGAGESFAVPSDRPCTLGRDRHCDVVLKHATVSRRHAEIRPEQDGFVLVDAGSQNGTYLGDNRITSTTLAGGDDIIIGVFRLTFHNSADPSETGTGTGQPG